MLNIFINKLETLLKTKQEISENLPKLRDLVRDYIKQDDFRLDCIEQTISSIEKSMSENKTWNAMPLFTNRELQFSIRLIFWPAFFENPPHQHKTWSITGVFYNQLRINVYELLESFDTPRKKRVIDAAFGETGFLMPGCIHSVTNLSSSSSASLHVFNYLDLNHPEESALWYGDTSQCNLSNGALERALITCLNCLAKIENSRSFHLLEQIYQLMLLRA